MTLVENTNLRLGVVHRESKLTCRIHSFADSSSPPSLRFPIESQPLLVPRDHRSIPERNLEFRCLFKDFRQFFESFR